MGILAPTHSDSTLACGFALVILVSTSLSKCPYAKTLLIRFLQLGDRLTGKIRLKGYFIF